MAPSLSKGVRKHHEVLKVFFGATVFELGKQFQLTSTAPTTTWDELLAAPAPRSPPRSTPTAARCRCGAVSEASVDTGCEHDG